MNRLAALSEGQEVAFCLIRTGSDGWDARRVPQAFARQALAHGWTLMLDTSRGWKPRRLIERRGQFFTREVAP